MHEDVAKSVADKLAPGRLKRLLALDGGGIGGLITIEILANIEETLARKLETPGLRLCDYFDYIAGTSTGALIATCKHAPRRQRSDAATTA